MDDSNFVLVVGMHRSGTSVVSGMLSKLGVGFGRNLLGATYANPDGHYEDKQIIKINEEILMSAGGSWDAPPTCEKIKVAFNKRKEEIRRYLRSEGSKESGAYFGVKEPRISLMLPMYVDMLGDVKIIYVVRDEEDVASSIKKRNKIGLRYGVKLCRYYNKKIDSSLKKSKFDHLVIDYEALKASPHKVIEDIVSFLGLEVSESRKSEVSDFVKGKEVLRDRSQELKEQDNKNILAKVISKPGRAVSVIFYILYRMYKRAFWKG